MQTAEFLDIQRRHVEQSRGIDIRAYAAEMLRRQEAKKLTKSNRRTSSQHKSASWKPNNAKQQAKRPVATVSAPVITNEKIHQAFPVSNDIAYQQLQQFILQEDTINQAIPVNGIVQNMPVPSHVPNMMAPTAMNDSSLYATRANDGQGLDEACFQELLAAVKKGRQIISQPDDMSATPGSDNLAQTFYANYHGSGIITRESLPAGSHINCNEKQNHLRSSLKAMRTEDDTSLAQKLASFSMTTAKGKPNAKPKGPKPRAKVGKKSLRKCAYAISDGVSKKGKPTKKVGYLKKKDFVCPYHGCGKAFERRHNLKVHTRRHTGEMPYICPKTMDGCFLYFRWRSSLRNHLKTVHNEVVPISQNNARGTVTATPILQRANTVSGQNTNLGSIVSVSTSSAQSFGSLVPGVSQNHRIKKVLTKKQGKARKNFPAVAVRQPTAQELARLRVAVLSKSSCHTAQDPFPEKSAQAKIGVIAQKNNVHATPCNSPAVEKDFMDISSFLATEDGMSNSPSSSNDEDDIFEMMDFDIPDHLAFPKLFDLPAPEEFFCDA